MATFTLNLAFGPAAGIGGTERRMLDVVSELRARNGHVRAIIPLPGDRPLVPPMLEAGACVVLYRNPADLIRRAMRSPADATLVFGARATYPLAIARRLPWWRGGRLLVAKVGLEPFRSESSMLVERLLIRSADLVVANSRAAAELAATRSGMLSDRIRFLPSALPPQWLSENERGLRSPVRIAMIGNALPEKEHPLGVRLFARLDEPDTVLDVFTNDGVRVQAVLRTLPSDLRQRVRVHEGVSITPELAGSVDVLLHPSSSESLPRVVLEARAQGAWVVGFEVGDLGEYASDRVAWGDEDGLLASLRRACGAARGGTWPAPVDVLTVPEYVDRLVTMVGELDVIGGPEAR